MTFSLNYYKTDTYIHRLLTCYFACILLLARVSGTGKTLLIRPHVIYGKGHVLLPSHLYQVTNRFGFLQILPRRLSKFYLGAGP